MTSEQLLAVVVATLFVTLFLSFAWMMRMQWQHAEKQSEQQERESAMLQAQLYKNEEQQRTAETAKAKEDANKSQRPSVGIESGGYIIVDLPESKKGLFQDLLRGFEDYARLLGYIVRFSVDNSYSDKLAFKFTLESGGIAVSTAQVKSDLREYIRKVERNEPLDDLPMLLPKPEHNLLLSALKNRIVFLQSTATMQKNTIDYYNALFKQLPNQSWGVVPGQNIIIQSGQGNQAPTYHALNSPQAVQGVENRVEQGIRIANSFNEREEQVGALGNLWSALYGANKAKDDGDPEKQQLETVAGCIQKAWNEMKEGEPPEPIRIRRWLETAKNVLKTFSLTEEVTEAARKVWELFNVGS